MIEYDIRGITASNKILLMKDTVVILDIHIFITEKEKEKRISTYK